MFFLANGVLDIFVTDEHKREKFTAKLQSGSYFGEVALLKNCNRTASVTSRNYGT